ncbi:hypothetical protein [Nocardia stercoris]|uniref:hypothetical protein n=1 Tax=Nocardia stercoris TaxID=2483361 RepID=UPI0011C389C4|nr:hypothetical protein [Nocardia stercoris]
MEEPLVEELVRAAERLSADLGDAGEILARRTRAVAAEAGGTGARMGALDREIAAEPRWIGESARTAEPFAPGFDAETCDAHGLPDTTRVYSAAAYQRMFEDRIGRRLTDQEEELLADGCIGMTALRLGLTDTYPTMSYAFGDPSIHALAAETERLLAPGEVANEMLNELAYGAHTRWEELTRLRAFAERGAGGPDIAAEIRAAEAEHSEWAKATAEQLRHTRDLWARIGEHRSELERVRSMAKIEEGRRGFARVSAVADRFGRILADAPANERELLARIRADPVLSRLRPEPLEMTRGVPPAQLEPVIYAKRFWTGQFPNLTGEGPETLSMAEPNPWSFAPDPVTGQVDMTADDFVGKYGYGNFDYGWYDRGSNTWWNADHGVEEGSDRPMLVFQKSPDAFFRSQPDWDAQVFGLALVRKVF